MKMVEYQSHFCEELLQFFGGAAFSVSEVPKKDGSFTLLETAAELPTFAAFAKKIGVTCTQLRGWEEKYPAFAYACEQARERQGDILLQNALRGNYASTFAVFAAKNLLGWKDSKETAQTPEPIVVSWEEENEDK